MVSLLHVCYENGLFLTIPLYVLINHASSLFPLYHGTREPLRLGRRATRDVLRSGPRGPDNNHVEQVCSPLPPYPRMTLTNEY